MQCFLVITIIVALSLLSDARPHHEVEWHTASLQTWPLLPANIIQPVQVAVPYKRPDAQYLLPSSTYPLVEAYPVTFNAVSQYENHNSDKLQPDQPSTKPVSQKRKNSSEPTTKSPIPRLIHKGSKSDKITDAGSKLHKSSNLLASDVQLLTAVQQPDSDFTIEKITPVSGMKLLQLTSLERIHQNSLGSTPHGSDVKVTATGHTAAGQPVPEIPTGVFFQPYYGVFNEIATKDNKKHTSLILEPSAKSVAGNGGTAVSAPVSRAILKKGTSARVLFRPESVAIAGVGGKAHAQADLIIDFVERK